MLLSDLLGGITKLLSGAVWMRYGRHMRLFQSAKMYILAFCLLAYITLGGVLKLTSSTTASSGQGVFHIRDLVIALATICLAVYGIMFLGGISSRVERSIIILVELSCILWFLAWLAQLGVTWVAIPHSRYFATILNAMTTILLGLRTFQILWQQRYAERR